MANVLEVKKARRTTDVVFPGADFLGGSPANPCNPYVIVGTLAHVSADTKGEFTITNAGTTGFTIDQLLHKITRVVGFYPDGTSYTVEKREITVDEGNDKVTWTRPANGAGTEIIVFEKGFMGALNLYDGAGS